MPGDANLNGFVDVSDFNRWSEHKFTSWPAWSGGDFTADGFVDASDFNQWNSYKFRSADGSGGLVVPEPSSGLLVVMLVILRERRRRLFVVRASARFLAAGHLFAAP